MCIVLKQKTLDQNREGYYSLNFGLNRNCCDELASLFNTCVLCSETHSVVLCLIQVSGISIWFI